MSGDINTLLEPDQLRRLFPPQKADEFFEALYGDRAEGAYDLELTFSGQGEGGGLLFELLLKQRPGHCLACNLTYGLPKVFEKHPVIDLKGLARDISRHLGRDGGEAFWQIYPTRVISSRMHAVPLILNLPE